MKHITIIAGTRPNFVKISPVIREIKKHENLQFSLVHTGQHYDDNMSSIFFKELDIPTPDANLNVSSGNLIQQFSEIMIRFDHYLQHNYTDLVLVVGDVTSTAACSIVAQQRNIKVAHIEAGIRSNDWTMPEEINRILTDSITNYFFTTSEYANENLIKSNVSTKNIFFVGNVMIDTLINYSNNFKAPKFFNELNLENNHYFILTLHRPANVDNFKNFKKLIKSIIESIDPSYQIIFPVHPRIKKHIYDMKLNEYSNLYLTDPLSYLEFMFLIKNSKAVITDSGGISEETTYMNIPCITLRHNTERPETIIDGTNKLIGNNINELKICIRDIVAGRWKSSTIPKYWDGNASTRIINSLQTIYGNE